MVREQEVVRALVTGGAGLLGSELTRSAPDGTTVEVTVHRAPAAEGVKSHRIDLTQPLAFFELAQRRRPDLVVHTAYSKTDGRATVDAATEVASACAAMDIPLVHISTDAVFDGEHSPYTEDALPSPVHGYGRSKVLAEAAVREGVADVAVVRTSLLLAHDGSDPTSAWAIETLRSGGRVTFFDDEIRMPMFVDDLAAQIWEIVGLPRSERAGVWHLVGPEALSRAQVGAILCERFGLDRSLVDVAAAPATGEPRPRDLRLSTTRAGALTCRARSVTKVDRHGEAQR